MYWPTAFIGHRQDKLLREKLNQLNKMDSTDGMDLLFSHYEGGTRLAVRLTPKATRNQVVGVAPDSQDRLFLRVAVTAPLEKGRANRALEKLLAETLRVPASAVRVVHGVTDRRKIVQLITRQRPATLWQRIRASQNTTT